MYGIDLDLLSTTFKKRVRCMYSARMEYLYLIKIIIVKLNTTLLVRTT